MLAHPAQGIVLLVHSLLLFSKDRPCVPLMPGPVQDDALEQHFQETVSDALGLDRHRSIVQESEQVETAERGGVLVLLADRLAEDLHFDVGRLLGELARAHALAEQGMQGVEQTHGKRAGSPQARRRRHVTNGAHVDRRIDLQEA